MPTLNLSCARPERWYHPMRNAVLGLVPAQLQERIIGDLQRSGFLSSEISAPFFREKVAYEGASRRREIAKGPAGGARTGGAIGAALGFVGGICSLAIPGVGPSMVAGPSVASLSWIAIGVGLGAITGAVVGFGIPEITNGPDEVTASEGNVLLSIHVETSDQRALAAKVLERGGAVDVLFVEDQNVAVDEDDLPRSART